MTRGSEEAGFLQFLTHKSTLLSITKHNLSLQVTGMGCIAAYHITIMNHLWILSSSAWDCGRNLAIMRVWRGIYVIIELICSFQTVRCLKASLQTEQSKFTTKASPDPHNGEISSTILYDHHMYYINVEKYLVGEKSISKAHQNDPESQMCL